MKKTSDFGKGFIYNLILFSKHCEDVHSRLSYYEKVRKRNTEHSSLFSEEEAIAMWFNASSDHFYELEIPTQWKRKKIGRIAKWLQEKALSFGHSYLDDRKKPTLKDFNEIFDKLEELALLIDKELGVKPIKTIWH